MELTYEDLQRFRGPIVYVWSRGVDVLYVGMSFNGLERPLASSHEQRQLRPQHNRPPGGAPCPGCGGRWKLRERAAGRCTGCQERAAREARSA